MKRAMSVGHSHRSMTIIGEIHLTTKKNNYKQMKQTFLFLTLSVLLSSCLNSAVNDNSMGYLKVSAKSESLIENSNTPALKNTSIDDIYIYLYNTNGSLMSGFPMLYKNIDDNISLYPGQYTILAQNTLLSNINLPSRNAECFSYLQASKEFTVKSEEVTNVELTLKRLAAQISITLSAQFINQYPDYSFSIDGIIFDSKNTAPAYFDANRIIDIYLQYTKDGEITKRKYSTRDIVERGAIVTFSFDENGDGSLEKGSSNLAININDESIEQDFSWDVSQGEDVDEETSNELGAKNNPLSVSQAFNKQDGTTQWVEGYIVGHVKGSKTVTRDYTEASDSNIAIANSPNETNISQMLFIELKGTNSAARTQLGLASTSGHSLTYRVKLQGTLEAYYSNAGLKGVSKDENFEIITQ